MKKRKESQFCDCSAYKKREHFLFLKKYPLSAAY
jgi:hypothetical protein